MSRLPQVLLTMGLLFGFAAAALSDDQSESTGNYYGTSTGYSGMEASPSGGIIGYQPIPNSALGIQTQGQPQQVAMTHRGQQNGFPNDPQVYDYTMWFVGQGHYTLGRDDMVRINIRNQPEFSGDFVVGPDGKIQYNYIGDLPVAGLTKHELQQVLEKILAEYIRVPMVTVTIIAYNSKAVYVIGEVNRPGKYIMRGDVIKLREAIIAAGLPTGTAALRRTHVIKPDLKKPRVRKINLKKILYKGKLKEDIDLYPGEIIVVPSTVLASINNFLSQLLNPITRATAVAAIGAGI
ncbi:MAG: polysaccharide biosynthesis/export family protein [Candidatus Omnitrophica bacterium]|nr:polysaccharide biosynthesis/export family protein [Candidatus Omnitrophota bacterium]